METSYVQLSAEEHITDELAFVSIAQTSNIPGDQGPVSSASGHEHREPTENTNMGYPSKRAPQTKKTNWNRRYDLVPRRQARFQTQTLNLEN